MTHLRRLLVLTTVAAIVAACGTPLTTSAPGRTASAPAATSPSAAPTRSAANFPSLTPLPPLSGRCVPVENVEPGGPFIDAQASIGRLRIDLQVTRIEELTGGRHVAVPPSRDLDNDSPGLLIGGHELLISPSGYFGGHQGPSRMEAATVTLTLDGAAPVDLAWRIVPGNENFDQFAVAVPDVAGSGRILVDFTWVDACYRLHARGSVPVRVASLALVGSCAIEREAAWAQLSALTERGLLFGDAKARLAWAWVEGTYADMSYEGDGPYALAMFDAQAPALKVAPGASIDMDAVDPGLALFPKAAWPIPFMRRDTVIAWLADGGIYGGGPDPKVLSQSELTPLDAGAIRMRAPEATGRYVASIALGFEYACGTGTVIAGFGIDVVAP